MNKMNKMNRCFAFIDKGLASGGGVLASAMCIVVAVCVCARAHARARV